MMRALGDDIRTYFVATFLRSLKVYGAVAALLAACLGITALISQDAGVAFGMLATFGFGFLVGWFGRWLSTAPEGVGVWHRNDRRPVVR